MRVHGVLAGHPPVHLHDPFQLAGREHAGQSQQRLLVAGIGDPRQRAHLGVGELPTGERRPNERQLFQPLGDSHVLPSLPERHPATP